MQNNLFCHLHLHSMHSLLDGLGKPKDYIAYAKELGFKYIACTDHGTIDGLITWQKECEKQNIVPILGCEAYIVPDAKVKQKEKRAHILLLVKNQKGWHNLCQLLTYANIEGFYKRARIDYESLLNHCEGLVISTACVATFLYLDKGMEFFEKLNEKIKDDLYLEVMPLDLGIQKELNKTILDLAKVYKKRIIATADCHYIREEDKEAQEMLLAIQSNSKWNDPKRWKFTSSHLQSADEMIENFESQGILTQKQVIRALLNTIEVAKKCKDFRIPKREIHIPDIVSKDIQSSFLKKLCFRGYKKIFGKSIKEDKEYFERFKEEFELIKKKNFINYFLLIWDLINYCKESDIAIGPGRGSVGGCLVAFLLGITAIDPIKYHLLFSRFISEDRQDYPDIDIDFDQSKGYLVKRYLENKYGRNSIAGISNFLKMKSRLVVKDVARTFDIPVAEVNNFTKIIDGKSEEAIAEAIKTPEGRQFYKKYPEVIRFAKKLEGQVKGRSQHAAAIVVSADDLTTSDRCNLVSTRSNQDSDILINWNMEDSEYVGLMKLDALRLSHITILEEAKRLIKENHGKNIDLNKINLEDKEVFKSISSGNNAGCFQISSWAMTKLIKEMKVENLQMLSAANALVRPGPFYSGMSENFIKRKHGKKWKKQHPIYEEICKDTYGVVIYQEQMMKVMNQMAGISLSDSDKIRKVIGKKRDPKEFEPYKRQFVEGCLKKKTFTKKEAEEFWHGLLEWASYGFNASHSFSYSLLGYFGAWLKHYFPTEFLCANLTFDKDEKSKKRLIEEANRLGLSLVLPKIGISDTHKWVAKDNKLFIPFIEIKGIGESTVAEAANFKKVNKNKGFFNIDRKGDKSKIQCILEDIGAFDVNASVDQNQIKKYFDFEVDCSPESTYPNLFKFLKHDFFVYDLKDILSFNLPAEVKISAQRKRYRNNQVIRCKDCGLRQECTRPVLSSLGIYNIVIIGEAPGKDEDREEKGFVGRSGDLLWKELEKYELKRNLFHVGNICRCYPKQSKTPNQKQIETCKKFILDELKQINCRLALVFGNTGIKAFTGSDGGILQKSGTIEWLEDYKMWICWCVHPSAVLRSKRNLKYFQEGIKSFSEAVKRMI